ncbi:glycoside hydrolase [Aspergillus sclerotioniger CBS 115572]|uniref:chitinase n=1 Tax=Aspergillus sclerotioniger CBS 115572 TaxID=1450535 RepID=A0A317VJI0_9EURO|nr:glycoside hydrolase [Aspergillus sclerotioniger CBS 115572]PWY74466.1 glycoside hydrolase [Aspergillus sclerotioniger CBS 115572]
MLVGIVLTLLASFRVLPSVMAATCDITSHSITRVIGYYNSGAVSRPCSVMMPYFFPQGIYSHIYFASGNIHPDTFEVIPLANRDKRLYTYLEGLHNRDFGQELWLSLGGWAFSDNDAPTATTFSDLAAADITQQNVFFTSLIRFMHTFHFSGVDIDWEYPVAADRNGRAEDYTNYPIFLANLKAVLDDYNFGLSITLPPSDRYLQHYDLASIEPSVDWFNFMSYDLHGTWNMGEEWNGAVNAHTNLTEIKNAFDLLWRKNIPPFKVNMGMAFHGRTFTLADPSCTEPGCTFLSGGDEGDCSLSAGTLFNSEINRMIHQDNLNPTLNSDVAVKTIVWNTDQWVAYDDQDTWKIKANFAKSQCLGGVFVRSVDEDDRNHTFSKGLMEALGNEYNLDIKTGLTKVAFNELSTTTGSRSQSSHKQYCRFVNCGASCPNGFTEVTRADQPSQIMQDSTSCPLDSDQTQKLCCPTSSKVPICQWRGFDDSGKCTGGCSGDETELGTSTDGCHSGYQSACCSITKSTEPWSQCQWTSCENDETCPSGYHFVAGSRQGWGGRKSCSGKQQYNYCCSGSVPGIFSRCEWTHPSGDYCSASCPSDSIRVAGQSIFSSGTDQTVDTLGCLHGNEAYCCSGAQQVSSPKSSLSSVSQEQSAEEFSGYLQKFLANPVIPEGWAGRMAEAL